MTVIQAKVIPVTFSVRPINTVLQTNPINSSLIVEARDYSIQADGKGSGNNSVYESFWAYGSGEIVSYGSGEEVDV